MMGRAPRTKQDSTAYATGYVSRFAGALRAMGFLGLTLPLMPIQAVFLKWSPARSKSFPHWYHKTLCRMLGIRLSITGELARDKPVLLIANHTGWLDIPVLSAMGPVCFVTKEEVKGWPLFAQLAWLQRGVYVNRERRTSIGQTANDMLRRLEEGDAIVLFAEGTSTDGNRVLPFKSSLFAAAKPSGRLEQSNAEIAVQTVSMAYTHLHGIPLGRDGRVRYGWFGDAELLSHIWDVLKSGPIDVKIHLGEPVPLDQFSDRKDLARHSYEEVRRNVILLLRGREPGAQSRAVPEPANDT